MNELLWHLEVPGVEGLVVGDVALALGHRDHHAVPLLAVHLLRRDGPLQVVLLGWGRERGGEGVMCQVTTSHVAYHLSMRLAGK